MSEVASVLSIIWEGVTHKHTHTQTLYIYIYIYHIYILILHVNGAVGIAQFVW